MENNILNICKSFKQTTGLTAKFTIMHDNTIGIKCEGVELAPQLGKLFFEKEGVKDFADLKEYAKRHPGSNADVDFLIRGCNII